QERGRSAPAADAAGLEETVRDSGHRADPAAAQAWPSGRDRGADHPRRGARERLDRVLVPAEDRPAPEAARRRRGLRARPPPAVRRAAFMPGATEADLLALAELALISALEATNNFSTLGINLRLAVNVPVNALVKLPISEIVRAHRPAIHNWAG